jgi:hypothetical protein
MDLPADQKARQAAVRSGQVGYIARGIVACIIGVLVMVAAFRHNPGEAGGLDAALKTLAAQPFGPYLLMLVSFGFLAFGVFCAFDARYHRI